MGEMNVYIVGSFDNQASWDDFLSRLTWYFTPFLDQIDRIEIMAPSQNIQSAEAAELLDPLIKKAYRSF